MRTINPDHIAWWFDAYRLKGHLMLEGYPDFGAPVARMLSVSERTAVDKINLSRLSHEDTIKLALALNLTEDEYHEIFLKGVKFKGQE